MIDDVEFNEFLDDYRHEFEQHQDGIENVCYRLSNARGFWKTFCTSVLVLNVVATGFRIPFASWPDRAWHPNNKSAMENVAFVNEALAELLRTGAVERSYDPQVVSPLSVDNKPGKKKRLCFDLRYVNSHVPVEKKSFESLQQAQGLVGPGQLMFKIDLKSGYHHVAMHHSTHRYLAFEWRGATYKYKVLPFGLNVAPFIFVKMVTKWRGGA